MFCLSYSLFLSRSRFSLSFSLLPTNAKFTQFQLHSPTIYLLIYTHKYTHKHTHYSVLSCISLRQQTAFFPFVFGIFHLTVLKSYTQTTKAYTQIIQCNCDNRKSFRIKKAYNHLSNVVYVLKSHIYNKHNQQRIYNKRKKLFESQTKWDIQKTSNETKEAAVHSVM